MTGDTFAMNMEKVAKNYKIAADNNNVMHIEIVKTY